MSTPASLAAVQIVVPSGTVTSWPSIVRLTVLISVGAGVEMATLPQCLLRWTERPLRDRRRNTTRRIPPYPQTKILDLSRFEQARCVQSAGLVVRLDHAVELLARQRGAAPRFHLQRLAQEALRQAVVGARPPLAGVERALGENDPPRRRRELLAVDVPARDRAEQPRPLGERGIEDAAQELAE